MNQESSNSNAGKNVSRIRELPQVNIHGTSFFVDVRLEEFRQVDNPHNRIPFDVLNETGSGRNTFFYDTEKKNAYTGDLEGLAANEKIRFTSLPSIWDLDRVGMRNLTQEYADSIRAEREKLRSGQSKKSEDDSNEQSNKKSNKR